MVCYHFRFRISFYNCILSLSRHDSTPIGATSSCRVQLCCVVRVQERRMLQQKEILRKQTETSEKIAARAFAQSYLADLVPSVFGTLADNGYFYDPVERGKTHCSTARICVTIFCLSNGRSMSRQLGCNDPQKSR